MNTDLSSARMEATAQRIAMSDIARLASVRRPVVSTWRTRFAKTDHPFPAPIATELGQDLFDAAAVAGWLSETHHGNNSSPIDDVAAFATTSTTATTDDPDAFDALTALLCLKSAATTPLGRLSRDELLDLADAYDPDDTFVYAELEAVGARLRQIATYADELADAAYNPAGAFETLMSRRFSPRLRDHVTVALDPRATELAAKIAVDLGDHEEIATTYVDSTPGSSDLLLAVVAEHGDRSPVDVMTTTGDEPDARLARRRLMVHDVYRANLRVDADGDFGIDHTVTHVAQFPTPAAPVMSDEQILTAIENITVQMDDSQRGVVIGPASALCDRITSTPVTTIRDGMLRMGVVHAIVRLPMGLVPSRPRQSLAIWVLGPADHDTAPGDRFTTIADLANVSLTGSVANDLAADLVAARGGRTIARAHAFRFVRSVATRTLVSASRNLVEVAPATHPALHVDPAELLLDIERSRVAATDERAAELELPHVELAPTDNLRQPTPATVGDLLDAGSLRAISGNRLDESHVGTGDGWPVIGIAELVGEAHAGARTIDRLLLSGMYGASRLTEPGDVVFCTSPRPAAIVDHQGSSVVAYPARVLRIDSGDPGGLVAAVVAADINALPATARQWRVWQLRRVRDDQRILLGLALGEVDRAREHTRRRLAELDRLATLVTTGVTGGYLSLQPHATTTKGR
ncbi:MAG TPA: hypothetical protein VIM10_03880 [Actinopolymorphaceae bacterium]|jgi:hypothetical protein